MTIAADEVSYHIHRAFRFMKETYNSFPKPAENTKQEAREAINRVLYEQLTLHHPGFKRHLERME